MIHHHILKRSRYADYEDIDPKNTELNYFKEQSSRQKRIRKIKITTIMNLYWHTLAGDVYVDRHVRLSVIGGADTVNTSAENLNATCCQLICVPNKSYLFRYQPLLFNKFSANNTLCPYNAYFI